MITKKKKIVVIGGGNGSAISICALKQYTDIFDISAVVSMSDSGGSSGRLRREFKTLPPGDIMRAVLAMSKHDYKILKAIFHGQRFSGLGKLDGHNVGNLFIVLSEKYGGDFVRTIRALEQAVGAVGMVYPATIDKTDMAIELNNGKIIKTDEKISHPSYDRKYKIAKFWLEPKGKIYPPAKKMIENADYIVFGPGSLYTSIIAVLAVGGIKEAIKNSKAKLIYSAGDAYHTDGETCPEELSGLVNDLEKYLPRKFDAIVYNSAKLDSRQKLKYKQKNWAVFAKDVENLSEYKLFGADFERKEGGLHSIKLGKILKKVISKI